MNRSISILLLSICLIIGVVYSTSSQPLRSLPTVNKDIKGQYTGYVTVSTKEYFFWFIESFNNPQQDPLVVWFSGGPGCSSMLGALTENGPFTVQSDETKSGKDKYYLVENKDTWANVANMLYIESPAGVGFSYNTDGNYTTGDNQTAEDNMNVILGFLSIFPEFANSNLFISGESYAGNYIPEVATLIKSTTQLNLKGILCGNPTFNYTTEAQYYIPFMANHGLLSWNDYQNLTNVCDGVFFPASGECANLMDQLSTNFDLINPYDILSPCKGDGPSKQGGCFTQMSMFSDVRHQSEETVLKALRDSQVFIPCLDESAIEGYLNRGDVQKALGVSTRNIPSGTWQPCSSVLNYTQYSSLIPDNYQYLLSQGLKVLVYSGDIDSCVPYLGTSQCVKELGYPVQSQWRPWTFYDKSGYEQVAGYIVQYDTSSAHPQSSLWYATVKGASHMVPQTKPHEALILFKAYMNQF